MKHDPQISDLTYKQLFSELLLLNASGLVDYKLRRLVNILFINACMCASLYYYA